MNNMIEKQIAIDGTEQQNWMQTKYSFDDVSYTLLYLLYFIALPCFSYDVMMYQDSAIVMQKYSVFENTILCERQGYAPGSNH